jgi:hypothetical protein
MTRVLVRRLEMFDYDTFMTKPRGKAKTRDVMC